MPEKVGVDLLRDLCYGTVFFHNALNLASGVFGLPGGLEKVALLRTTRDGADVGLESQLKVSGNRTKRSL